MSNLDGWLLIAALAAAAAVSTPRVRSWARRWAHQPQHAARVLPPVVPGEGDSRFGAMCLQDEPEVHHDRPDFVDTFVAGIHDRYWPPPTVAEVAASRAAHGYIPELDPGPEAAAPAPSPDQTFPFPRLAPDHDPPPSIEFDGPWGHLGPRACAVLAGYEQRRGARKWATS